MKKPHIPLMQPTRQEFTLAIARIFDVPLHLIGALPDREGRRRSNHRHRNHGRA